MKMCLSEVLSKFENGVDLYHTSAIFNHCVKSIALGGNVYHLLEEVILITQEQNKVMQDILNKSTVPVIFYKPELENEK